MSSTPKKKIKAGSKSNRSSKENPPFPWKTYLCFFTMTSCARGTEIYYQGIADTALGCHSTANVGILMSCQYLSEIVCGMTTSYWSKLSVPLRLSGMAVVALSGLIAMSMSYQESKQTDGCSLLHFPRMIVILCVCANAVATLTIEITLLQYLTFYPKSCTNAVTTGMGIGALFGATWAMTIESFGAPWISIICCTVFPIVMVIVFFGILPEPMSLSESLERTKNEEIDIDQQNEDDASNIENIGACKALIVILKDYYKYSIPAMLNEILFEITRCGFVMGIWPSDKSPFLDKFTFVFYLGSAAGSLSSNFWATTRYRKLLIVLSVVAVVFGILYFLPTGNAMVAFIRETIWGRVLVLCLLTLPLGSAYGAITANTYYAVRTNIKNEALRSFVMGGVASAFVYGQVIGSIAGILLHLMPSYISRSIAFISDFISSFF